MFCKNCGYENKDDTKFCASCGTSLERREVDSNYNSNVVWQNEADRIIDYDEEIINAYIGNEKLNSSKFNIWAILFGVAYYAYRKMYLESFIIILTQILLGIFIPSIGEYIGLFWGFAFCPLYLMSAKRKVYKIKNENPAASLDELNVIAAKKGGTSVLSCIGFVLLDIFMILILLFILP